MNCENIKEKIDQLVFENNDQMSLEISLHTENCEDCKAYFKTSIQPRKLINQLQNFTPALKEPDLLTNEILDIIQQDNKPEINRVTKRNNVISLGIVQKFLAAASIALLMVFGYEQYIVVEKVIALEEKMSVPATNVNSFQNYNKLFTLLPPDQVAERLLSTFENSVKKKPHSKLKTMILIARLGNSNIKELEPYMANQLINKKNVPKNNKSEIKKEKTNE